MKIAPIVRALRDYAHVAGQNQIVWQIVHTGQHYDYAMSQSFFDDLEIPRPDFFLEAGSRSHAEQTAIIMTSFEKICLQEKPDIVLVVGDVNSTLACSIVAKKLLIGLGHVEAGLRSFDLTMPEEINRLVTDAITDYFFVTEQDAVKNLVHEGKAEDKIFFVGHVMIDNLLYQQEKLTKMDEKSFSTFPLKEQLRKYAFLTLHRPANVDNRKVLSGIIEALSNISTDMPIFFPVHPRTKKMLASFQLELPEQIIQLHPLGFQEALFLWQDAELVLTDSGGLQEETTGLGVPCFTIRENTERPITVDEGTNTLVGVTKNGILREYERFKGGQRKKGNIPELWDGKASQRIVECLAEKFVETRVVRKQNIIVKPEC